MAFTGTPVIQKISESKFRITGVSLAAAATGTIGLTQHPSAEVQLEAPQWDRYQTPGLQGGQVEVDAAVEVRITYVDAAGTTTEPVTVTKTGDSPVDFLATLTNRDAAASGELEIYVEFA